jgi:riboflavin kinase/FMN adenylyltransferase
VCRVYRQLTAIPAGAALTIGNFDGVHSGHQLLVQRIIQAKQQGASAACVMLFEPHPRDFFAPSQRPTRLMSFAQKYRILRDLGVDIIFCLSFNHTVANQPYKLFWHRLLQAIEPSYVILGQDFRFGYKREGSVDYIRSMASDSGYQVEIIADHTDQVARISSTRLRQLLQQQDWARYQRLAGRRFSWYGKGTNYFMYDIDAYRCAFPARQLPLDGVYLVQVTWAQMAVHAVAILSSAPSGRRIVLYRLDKQGFGTCGGLMITWIAYMRNYTENLECKAQIYRDISRAAQLV